MRKALLMGLVVLGASVCLATTTRAQGCGTIDGTSLNFPNNPGGDDAECPKLCKKWVNECKKVVKGQTQCADSVLDAEEGVEKADCKTFVDPIEKKACQDELKALVALERAGIDAESSAALQACSDDEADCVADCES